MDKYLALSLLIQIHCLFANPIVSKSPLEGELFEGDIAGVDRFNISKGIAQTGTSSNRWPGAQVQLDTIYAAMKHIEDSTRINGRDCIKFVQQTTQSNWIRLISGNGCYSNVGKNIGAGEQIVSLEKPGCVTVGLVTHELMHALGFWHEQSRPDRDNYVTINWNNIQAGQSSNFDKYTSGIDTLGFPYDYDSVLHYQTTAFSVNGLPTILPKVSGVSIGNKPGLSSVDIQEIRKYYNCA